jgi:hypothetical protein
MGYNYRVRLLCRSLVAGKTGTTRNILSKLITLGFSVVVYDNSDVAGTTWNFTDTEISF